MTAGRPGLARALRDARRDGIARLRAAHRAGVAGLREALRFAPVRPAVAAGFRAALATVVPIIASQALARPELAWTGLAGFLAALVDRGGAYRTRARAMAGFVLAATALGSAAALVGASTPAVVSFAFAAATVLGFARVWGPGAATAGSCALVLTLVSLAQPASPEAALARGGWVALGGAWAMLLALFLWPVRLYRPARLAVGKAVRALAAYLDGLAPLSARPTTDADAATLGRQRGVVRQALEDARATLAATRRGRRGDTGRGELLLVMTETTDRMFGVAASLTELVDGPARRGPWPDAADRTASALAALAKALREVARATERERPDAPIALPPPVARAATTPDIDPVAAAEHAHVVASLDRLGLLLERARDAALGLVSGREPEAAPPTTPGTTTARARLPALDAVRAHLTQRSLVARHAVRVGVVTAVASALAHGLALERGYWVTLAAAATLQPQLPDTFLKVTQRVLGTMVGALIAAALTGVIDDPRLMLAVVFCGAVVSVSAQPVSYALFATFLTPTFVLLAEARAHDPSLVGVRVVDTLVGGGVALLGARLLWPVSERDWFPATAATALRTLRRSLWVIGSTDAARRELGVAILNAEASLQRWLAEVERRPSELEAQMTLVAFMRRLAAAALALGHVTSPPATLVAAADATLLDLEGAVADRRPPAALDEAALDAATAAPDPVLAARAERLTEALRVLHGAATRWLGDGAPSP